MSLRRPASTIAANQTANEPHAVDQRPPVAPLLLMGIQHVLVMYAASITVPIIVGGGLGFDESTVGVLINANLIVSGVATVIQSFGVGRILGVRLPVVAGATFVAVTPMIMIGKEFGMATVYGAMLASGVFGLIVARPFARIVRFFPPLVSGTVITMIGLSLVGSSADLIAGDDSKAAGYGNLSSLAIAAVVIAVVVAVTRFGRGLLAQSAIFLGLIVGTLVAVAFGQVHLPGVGQAAWFGLETPFRFGPPKFQVSAVMSMCIVLLITYTESTADMIAVADATGRELGPNDLGRGLAADGFAAVLGAVFSAFPGTAYAGNVGLVELTKVRSRYVVTVAGVILLAIGLVPKLGLLIASIPNAVAGGAALVMFGMVAAVGIRILQRVPFNGNNNLMILAVSIGVGLVPVVAPDFYKQMPETVRMICANSITSTVIVAFTLNLIFNHRKARPRQGAAEGLDDGP